MKTIYYLYLSVISFFCFFFLTIFIINGNQLFFDIPIYNFLSSFSLTSFFKFITNFGNVHYLLVFVFVTFFIFKKKSNWKFLVCLMIFESLLNVVLKVFFSRPRPNVLWLIEENGFSFPSGHMMASTVFYGLCIYFVLDSDLSIIWKSLFSLILLFFIVTIGLSRIYLGVHYASDILGGFLLSFCILNFGIFFYRSMHNEKESIVLSQKVEA